MLSRLGSLFTRLTAPKIKVEQEDSALSVPMVDLACKVEDQYESTEVEAPLPGSSEGDDGEAS